MTLLHADGRSLVLDDPAAGVRITATREPGDALLGLLARLRFGSDGLRYRRLNVAEQLARLPTAVYLSLELDGRIAGSYVLAETTLASVSGPICGIYRGLLGVDPSARSQGVGRQFVKAVLGWVDDAARRHGGPVLSWGCIESANRPSLNLLQSLGGERLGELETLTVFRQWPRRRIGIVEAGAGLEAAVSAGLAETYEDCALRPARYTAAGFRAVTDERGIVAGARASLTRVDIGAPGGVLDCAWHALLRRVAPARRRFDPRDFRYLRLSDVIVREGAERVWRDLLPTLLAEHDAYFAMFMLDPSSRARARLGRAGLFGHLTARTRQRVAVLAHTWGLAPRDRRDLASRPLAIGPLDL